MYEPNLSVMSFEAHRSSSLPELRKSLSGLLRRLLLRAARYQLTRLHTRRPLFLVACDTVEDDVRNIGKSKLAAPDGVICKGVNGRNELRHHLRRDGGILGNVRRNLSEPRRKQLPLDSF